MSADRSNTERLRRIKAVTIAQGPNAPKSMLTMGYETRMVRQFGRSRYLYQQTNGAIIEQPCCPIILEPAMWVAVGEDTTGNSILYSMDGKTWLAAKGSFGVGGYYGIHVAYGNDIWVSTGSDSAGNNLKWSSNGIEWYNASYNKNAFDIGKCAVYGGDIWIAVDSAGKIVTSTNGKEWTDRDGDFFGGGGIYDIAYNNDASANPLWVAVGKNGIFWSPDGEDWNDSSGSTFDGGGGGYGVAYGGNKWVALGVPDLSGNSMVWSYDGKYWYDSSGPQFGLINGHGIAYNGDIWVASGNSVDSGDASGNTMLWSPDGESWNRTFGSQLGDAPILNAGGGGYYGAVAYGDTTWVTVGYPNPSGNTIVWSPDGIQWSPANTPTFDTDGNCVAYRRVL